MNKTVVIRRRKPSRRERGASKSFTDSPNDCGSIMKQRTDLIVHAPTLQGSSRPVRGHNSTPPATPPRTRRHHFYTDLDLSMELAVHQHNSFTFLFTSLCTSIYFLYFPPLICSLLKPVCNYDIYRKRGYVSISFTLICNHYYYITDTLRLKYIRDKIRSRVINWCEGGP